jgi:hypothetical protein
MSLRLSDTFTDANGDGDGYSNSYSDVNSYSDANRHGHSYPNSDCYRYANGYSYSDGNSNSDSNSDNDSDGDGYSDSHSNPGRYPNADGNTDPNTCWNTDPKSDPGGASRQPLDSHASGDWRQRWHWRLHHYGKRSEACDRPGHWTFLDRLRCPRCAG